MCQSEYILSTLDHGYVSSTYEYLVISPSIKERSIWISQVTKLRVMGKQWIK